MRAIANRPEIAAIDRKKVLQSPKPVGGSLDSISTASKTSVADIMVYTTGSDNDIDARPPTSAAGAIQDSFAAASLIRPEPLPSVSRFPLSSIIKTALIHFPSVPPSVAFSVLALDNVSRLFFDLYVGEAGARIEEVLYPLLSYIVNHATANESQREWVEKLGKLWRPETPKEKENINNMRIKFAVSGLVAHIATIVTIPMALDAGKRLGLNMNSEYDALNKFEKGIAIFSLSFLYTVITRWVATNGLLFEEMPAFKDWLVRKWHLLRDNDPHYKYFKADVLRFLESDLKEKKYHRRFLKAADKMILELRDIVARENNHDADTQADMTVDMIYGFLETTGYRMFPTRTKMIVTSVLTAGCPLLGLLLNKLARSGVHAVGLPEAVESPIAITAVALTVIFYVRACIKFYDRTVDAYLFVQEAFFPKLRSGFYFALFTMVAAIIALTTSAGFVFMAKQMPIGDSKIVQQLHKLLWVIFAGLVANGGYFFLQLAKVALSSLNASTDQEYQRLHNNEYRTIDEGAAMKVAVTALTTHLSSDSYSNFAKTLYVRFHSNKKPNCSFDNSYSLNAGNEEPLLRPARSTEDVDKSDKDPHLSDRRLSFASII